MAPELPDAITVSASFRSLQIDYDAPADLDYKDTRVWLSQSTGFTPGPANQVAQAYGGPVVIAGLADGTEYFLRFATYDAFGQGTMSSEFSVTTASLSSGDVDGLGPWATVTDADKAFIDANLDDDAIEGTKIVKLTASKIVTGTLAATEKISVAGQVESLVGNAVATLGPKSADGKTGMITYQYNGSTLFAVYSDGSAAFSGAVTITGGSGYANLSDKPGSLGDINGSELTKLNDADANASQALADAADAQAAADGKITSYYQDDPPLNAEEGDLWFKTDAGDHPYRWDEEDDAWIDVQDGAIGQALNAASDAQSTADGKVTTFFSTSTPTAEGIGDLWYNDTTKLMKRWNGSAWVNTATAGADWSSNLSNIPDRLGDTPSTGLNLTATHMGYYDGANWTAYIDDNGDFYFGDGAQSYIQFDNDELELGADVKFYGTNSVSNPGLFIDMAISTGVAGDFYYQGGVGTGAYKLTPDLNLGWGIGIRGNEVPSGQFSSGVLYHLPPMTQYMEETPSTRRPFRIVMGGWYEMYVDDRAFPDAYNQRAAIAVHKSSSPDQAFALKMDHRGIFVDFDIGTDTGLTGTPIMIETFSWFGTVENGPYFIEINWDPDTKVVSVKNLRTGLVVGTYTDTTDYLYQNSYEYFSRIPEISAKMNGGSSVGDSNYSVAITCDKFVFAQQ